MKSCQIDSPRCPFKLASISLDRRALGGNCMCICDRRTSTICCRLFELASPSAPRALPIKLQNGVAVFDGAVTGSLNEPQLAGHVAVTNVMYAQER